MLIVTGSPPQHQVTEFAYKNHSRLSIIDPNNPANDIAGGSSNTATILAHFAGAHQDLTRRMAELAQDPNRSGKSILEVILGGNYSSFENQRNYLEALAKGDYRPSDHGSRPAKNEIPKNQPARHQQARFQPAKSHPLPPRPPQGKHGSSRRRR